MYKITLPKYKSRFITHFMGLADCDRKQAEAEYAAHLASVGSSYSGDPIADAKACLDYWSMS
jgi:hypothetical protein